MAEECCEKIMRSETKNPASSARRIALCEQAMMMATTPSPPPSVATGRAAVTASRNVVA